MKSFEIFLRFSILSSVFTIRASSTLLSSSDSHLTLFRKYVEDHKFNFKDGEYTERLKIFKDNLALIDEHNKNEEKTYTLGISPFTHMTREEFKAFLERNNPHNFDTPRPDSSMGLLHTAEHGISAASAFPVSKDWVAEGAVTPVKNQGQCGSCWTFSVTGALEGAYFVQQGTLPYAGIKDDTFGFYGLSEQQLNACNYLSMGCNGGWVESGFIWAARNNGLTSERQYPYEAYEWSEGQTYQCKTLGITNDKSTAPMESSPFTFVDSTVDAMMSAVLKQPIAIAIKADDNSVQFYKSGVITGINNCPSTPPNHAVLLVGYGSQDGIDYWKVKNSWGQTYGQEGYFLIERSAINVCGVLSYGSYPNLVPNGPTATPTANPTAKTLLKLNGYPSKIFGTYLNLANTPVSKVVLKDATMNKGKTPAKACFYPLDESYAGTYSLWVYNAVYSGNTYLAQYLIWSSNGYLYLQPYDSPYIIPGSFPSCEASIQLINQVPIRESWVVSKGYATSDSGQGVGVRDITYFALTGPSPSPTFTPTQPTPFPTPLPTRAPTFPPTKLPTRQPTASPTRTPVTSSPTVPTAIRNPTRTPTRTPIRTPTPKPTKRKAALTDASGLPSESLSEASSSSIHPSSAGEPSREIQIGAVAFFSVAVALLLFYLSSRKKQSINLDDSMDLPNSVEIRQPPEILTLDFPAQEI